MPSSYNKYLEYLGHVDDTTKDDFLAREAKIRMEVDALKQQCKDELRAEKEKLDALKQQCRDELRIEKEKLDSQLKIARDSVVQEQKRSSEQLAKQEKDFLEKTQKFKQEISDLNKQIQIIENRAQATLKEEKEKMKKEFSVREAELISANDSLHQEMDSGIKKGQDDAKRQKQEIERKYNQKIKELEGNITNLKREIADQKQLYEKSIADQVSHYEQVIKQLNEKNKKISFLDWLKSVFTIKKDDTINTPRQADNQKKKTTAHASDNGQKSNGLSGKTKKFSFPDWLKSIFTTERSYTIKDSRPADKATNSSKVYELLLTRQDFEQNTIGAIGYLFSVIGLVISWMSILGAVACLIGILLSDIGRRKPDNLKAMLGIILGFTGLIVYAFCRVLFW